MKLSKGEKVLLEIMNEVDWFVKDKKKIKKIVEGYFIGRDWMNLDGSFKMNGGGKICMEYMEKRDWL